ncbi:hypothetical protein ABIC02_002025 [Bradyrhizobium sp. RT5a]
MNGRFAFTTWSSDRSRQLYFGGYNPGATSSAACIEQLPASEFIFVAASSFSLSRP